MRRDIMVTVGEKVDVAFNLNSQIEKTYFSMVQDISDDGTIAISLPMSKGEIASLHIGEQIAINYFRYHGQYYFIANVVGRFARGDSQFLRIEKISEIRRLQRRSFYRLAKTIPVTINILSKDDDSILKTIQGHTIDICGGGLGIVLDQRIPVDSFIQSTLKLDDESDSKEIVAKGRVVRCEPMLERDDKFELGISFKDILEGHQDAIIKFIFNEQRLLRQRGLL